MSVISAYSQIDGDLVIRERTSEDIEELWNLEKCWASEDIMPNPYSPTPKPELEDYAYLIVATVADRIIGFICGDLEKNIDSITCFPSGIEYVEIEETYVVPKMRSRGIGGALLEAVLKRGIQDGVRKFHLVAVNKDPKGVQKFYRAHGFKRWGERGKYGEYEMIWED